MAVTELAEPRQEVRRILLAQYDHYDIQKEQVPLLEDFITVILILSITELYLYLDSLFIISTNVYRVVGRIPMGYVLLSPNAFFFLFISQGLCISSRILDEAYHVLMLR